MRLVSSAPWKKPVVISRPRKKQTKRPPEEDYEPDVEPVYLSSVSDENDPGDEKRDSDQEGSDSDSDEESDSGDVDPPPSQTKPGTGKMASVSPHQPAKENTANPLSLLSPKKLAKPGNDYVIHPLPRGEKLPTRTNPSSNGRVPMSSQSKTIPATKIEPRPTPSSSSSKTRNQGPSPPNKNPAPPSTQPPPIDPPKLTEPERLPKAASQPAKKSAPPEKTTQGGPTDLAGVASNLNPDAAAAAKGPSLPQVMEPEPGQNEALAESGDQSEGPRRLHPYPSSPTQNSHKSDIESLYASPSPGKVVTELEPIELDSDPDFEMMEQMLLSHRGPSSQSRSIEKESGAQSPVPSKAGRPLKRQRSHASPDRFSQAPTQIHQVNSKPVKRPRVDGPRSSNLVAALNDRTKHPEFWDLDGNVVLQVDNILFRVTRSTLSKASPWFQRLFSEESDHLETIAGCPLYTIEEDFSHNDFANLLRGLENGMEYALNPPHYLCIMSIFRAASLLEFNTLRRWSLGCLEKQWPAQLPPPSKPSKFGSGIPWAGETLAIADRFDVPQLIKRAYWELCTRSEFGKVDAEVFDDEAEKIMPTRSRLPRSVLFDLTRIRERSLPEWTRITRTPPIDVPCTRATNASITSSFTTQPTSCSLDYANWHKVVTKVEVDDMTIDDRRMDPISALEVMIVEIDWEKEGGFCADCVKEWKMIWTKDREKIWKNLSDWLGLDVATKS